VNYYSSIGVVHRKKKKGFIPYEYNPRKLSEDKKQKLRESGKYNLVEIPAINTNDVTRHQRSVLMEIGVVMSLLMFVFPIAS
jgi:hypothetical protein